MASQFPSSLFHDENLAHAEINVGLISSHFESLQRVNQPSTQLELITIKHGTTTRSSQAYTTSGSSLNPQDTDQRIM